ncbi:MAG: type restriction enzyme MjaXIP specificity protein [Lachnospiraceae bacterium]|nr:type restriction enzyme MjaXIP specificity protein [Lachnospiraceae bacterium]MDF2843447.1 type restriction enzyme MjaXIP specificity protein [Herbinix sp.]
MDLLKEILNFNDLPNEWSVEKLGDHFDFYNGLSLSRNLLNDSSETLCLHYGDIHVNSSLTSFNTTRDRKWLPRIDMDINDARNGVSLENGDLVFADASEDYEGIGKSIVIVNEDESDFIAGLHTIVAKDKTSKLDIDYKKYFLQPIFVRKQFRRIAAGSSVYGTNKSEIANICFLLPGINEQKKIGAILENVDINILNISKKIKYLTDLKKALAKKLLTEGIGHTEFRDSELGRIPVEWKVKKLGDIFKVASGNGLTQADMNDGEYPVYGGNGINGYHNEYMFEEKKIIIGRVGAKCGCVHFTNPFAWITDNALFIEREFEKFDITFMYYLLTEMNLNKYANQNAQPVISGQKIYNLYAAFPEEDEQKRISDILTNMDRYINLYQAQKEDYNQLKEGLMQQLFTGKLRIKIKD